MAGGPYNPMGGPPMGGPMGGNNGMGGPPTGGPPPMSGPPMLGPPPMHATPMPDPGRRPPVMRRGTSRVVPVVVSAGLAIGVFCGLLFGVGTGQEVIASPSSGNNASKVEKIDDVSTMASANPTPAKKPPPPATTATPAAGSGSGSAAPAIAAGSGSGSGSAAPAVLGAKLTIGLKPDNLAKTASVTVDGTEMKDGTMDVTFDAGTTKKTVKVMVKAAGYADVEKMIEVDADTRVEIELLKAAKSTPAVATTPATTPTKTTTATAVATPPKTTPPKTTPPKTTPAKTTPAKTKQPPKKAPGNLIDI